jgi:hypothetical protein
MNPTEAMTNLQEAIDRRIGKETAFINAMVTKFRNIKTQLQEAITGKNELEGILRPHIDALNAATNQLDSQRPLADVEESILNVESDSEPQIQGGRRRSKRHRKRQSRRKSTRK